MLITRHDGAARHPTKNGKIVPTFEEFAHVAAATVSEAWKEYILHVQELEDESGESEPSKSATGLVIEEDAAGIPRVPSIVRVEDGDRVQMMKKQIQLFISRHHGRQWNYLT